MPSALSGCTHSPFIWSVMSRSWSASEHHRLNGRKASDWLRQTQQRESRFRPKSFTTFSKRYPFRALRLLIPSRLEGMWGIVGRKAGSLADTRHIQAHLNDCSQHSSKFICCECGMVSETFLWHMHFFLFSIQNLFYLFKTNFLKNYLHCFFRSMKHLT